MVVITHINPHILHERNALHEQGTLFEIARMILSAGVDMDDLMRRISRVVVERHGYDNFSIYLSMPERSGLKLAFGVFGAELPEEDAARLAHRSVAAFQALTEPHRASWRIAVPIRSGSAVLGAMVAALDEATTAVRTISLLKNLAPTLAVGIQHVNLQIRQLEIVAEHERSRIAREIHDGVAQSMYALNLGIENCARLAERGDETALSELLSSLVPLSKQTLLEIRHCIYDLAPLLSSGDNFIDSIEKQVGEFRAVSAIQTRVEIEGGEWPVPMPVRVCVNRILHEALSNALKHSEASNVHVALMLDSDSLSLLVMDDGVGFEPEETRAGYGLGNMRQRAEEIGGVFSITVSKGAGAEIRVNLPLDER